MVTYQDVHGERFRSSWSSCGHHVVVNLVVSYLAVSSCPVFKLEVSYLVVNLVVLGETVGDLAVTYCGRVTL